MLSHPCPPFRGDCYLSACEVCVLHGTGARLLSYCDSPVVIIRITVGSREMARGELKTSYPSPVPARVKHVVLLFQVQRPWLFSRTSLWFVLACTTPVLHDLRAWQTLSIVIQDGDASLPEHNASPSDFDFDPEQEEAYRDVARVADIVNSAFLAHSYVKAIMDPHRDAFTPYNSPQGSGSNTPPTPPEWQPGRDEQFRCQGFDPDLLPTRRQLASCLNVCGPWRNLTMWDHPINFAGRLAAFDPHVRFMTMTDLSRMIGSQMMPYVLDLGGDVVFAPILGPASQ